MPLIRVEMFPGRTVAHKRELAAALTREMVRICGVSPESVIVRIEEVQKENWSIGGTLCSDRYPDPRPLGDGS